jgi:hypothetical protein
MGRNPGAPGGGAGGRLILPGEHRFGGGQQQQRSGGGPPLQIGLDGPEPSSGPGQLPPTHKFRPPPGFMNDDTVDPSLSQADPQVSSQCSTDLRYLLFFVCAPYHAQ